jgi:hypothetical protein
MFSGRVQRLFPPIVERLAARHIQLPIRIAHSKRLKDGYLAYYEGCEFKSDLCPLNTPDIWVLLPFLPIF